MGEPCRSVNEHARCVHRGRHVRDLTPDRLELADRAPELLTHIRVPDRKPQSQTGPRQAEGCNADPTGIEHLQELLEPANSSPIRFSSGTKTSSKISFRLSEGLPAELLQALTLAVARDAVRYKERSEAPSIRILSRRSEKGHPETHLGSGVRDEHLRAVDHPSAVGFLGRRADGGGIRTG